MIPRSWNDAGTAILTEITGIFERSLRFDDPTQLLSLRNAVAGRRHARLPVAEHAHLEEIVQACATAQCLDELITEASRWVGDEATRQLRRLHYEFINVLPAVWGDVPPRNPNFTGRAELLDDLRERLASGTTAVLPEALHGMGGVGKTQVAVEYAYLHAGEYNVVWWIPAEHPAQIAASMAELARRLDLPVEAEAAAASAVKEALRLGKPYTKWLLIFDNADKLEDVRPQFPAGGPGHVLVTSRNSQWSSVARAVEVDVFRREESQALLTRRTPTLSAEDSDALARVLGDLPLAIEQAAAWLAETGMQAGEYLALFQEKRMELMEMSPPADYQLPVAAAWNVSLDHLARTRPAALRLLQLCAFLAPEPIARTLLSTGRGARRTLELAPPLRNPIQLGQAVREINRYALARIDHAKNTIQMHRLVQAVLIERMTHEERAAMRPAAHQLLAANNPQDPADRSRWQLYNELYPHLVASGAITDAEDDWVRDLVIDEAKYHLYRGDPRESLYISRAAYDGWRKTLGEDAPQTLEIGRWLGYVLFSLGHYQQAAALNAALLELHMRSDGDNPESLLEAMQAVASDHRTQGRFQSALDLSREVHDRCGQLFGNDDPLTLTAGHNLAVSLRLVARFEEAYDIDRATWERKIQVYGQNHEETLRTQRGVLIDRRQLGDYIASHEEFERLADSFARSLGRQDLQTVDIMRSLTVARSKVGDYGGALSLARDVLQRYNETVGAGSPDSLFAAFNLASALRHTGDLLLAKGTASENLQRFRGMLGENHPHTVAVAGSLAIILRLIGEVGGARALNTYALSSLRDSLRPDHPLTLSCATNLASDLFTLGEIAEAHAQDSDNVRQYRESLGDGHPSTLAATLNLAIDLRALGRTGEADLLHDEQLARYQRILGENHPWVTAATRWRRIDCDLDLMPL